MILPGGHQGAEASRFPGQRLYFAPFSGSHRYLVGKDPTDIEFLWQAMYRGPRYRGGAVLMSAMSAVEIALWDILGQALGQPIWRLLGGKARDKVRIYPHADGGTPEDYARNWLKRKE